MTLNIEALELKVAKAARSAHYCLFPEGREHSKGAAIAYNDILCEFLGITGDDVTDNIMKCYEKHKATVEGPSTHSVKRVFNTA